MKIHVHECYPPANENLVEWYIFMQVRATQKTINTVLTIWGSCFKIYPVIHHLNDLE